MTNIMNTSSLDIVCATDVEEFYYKETDKPVPENEPVGLDVETKEGVDLVLFSDVYWNPPYSSFDNE